MADTRTVARGLIMAGRVVVNGKVVDKAGTMVSPSDAIEVKGDPRPYVSRGGLKLKGALNDFSLGVEGLICLDIGSSTGGFTDCLLKEGASHVYAVDVGKNLMDGMLRSDERVTLLEGVNARYARGDLLPEKVDLITVDVSFISLTLIIPAIIDLLKPGGKLIPLVKPQFELSRKEVGKKGVVREANARDKAIVKISSFLSDKGFRVIEIAPSCIKGPAGNQEYFIHSVLAS